MNLGTYFLKIHVLLNVSLSFNSLLQDIFDHITSSKIVPYYTNWLLSYNLTSLAVILFRCVLGLALA